MSDISDVLIVSFDNGLKDESVLCVTRKYGEKTIMLKMELGEQADILYRLLIEQMTKAEIKAESKEEKDMTKIEYMTELKAGLCGFDKEVRDEIINDYEEHFDEGIALGKS